jgi:antitoxin component YwqK of YwqJK toxin-antitoxin module
MKTSLTLLLSLTFLFLFSGSVYGQEEVKKKYWDNGKIKSETHWKDGKPDGLSTYWYESGKNQIKTHYKNGERDGLVTTWWENGVKSGETHYTNGKNEGLETTWSRNSIKRSEIPYKNGKREGLTRFWYESGTKNTETPYKNGEKEGLETWWYESGKKKSESHYKNGKKEGLDTWWYESGNKKRETLRTPQGFYIDGINEKSDTLETTWWENEKLRTKFYFRGKTPTLWTWWYKSGIKQSEELSEDGKRVIITNFNESGKKVIEYKYKKGELFSQSNFYPTGIKKSRKYFKGGLENGLRTEWSEDGKKTYEGNFVNGNEE